MDIKFIRENKEIVLAGAKKKNVEFDMEKLVSLDDKRLLLLKEVEGLRGEINRVSSSIARDQDPALKVQLIEEMRLVKEDIKEKEARLKEVMKEWQGIMLQIPNLPSPDTPEGLDESANKVLREWGKKTEFSFKPKEHYEIGEALGMIDSKKAAQVSGSRFTYLKGDLVLLQRLLDNGQSGG